MGPRELGEVSMTRVFLRALLLVVIAVLFLPAGVGWAGKAKPSKTAGTKTATSGTLRARATQTRATPPVRRARTRSMGARPSTSFTPGRRRSVTMPALSTAARNRAWRSSTTRSIQPTLAAKNSQRSQRTLTRRESRPPGTPSPQVANALTRQPVHVQRRNDGPSTSSAGGGSTAPIPRQGVLRQGRSWGSSFPSIAGSGTGGMSSSGAPAGRTVARTMGASTFSAMFGTASSGFSRAQSGQIRHASASQKGGSGPYLNLSQVLLRNGAMRYPSAAQPKVSRYDRVGSALPGFTSAVAPPQIAGASAPGSQRQKSQYDSVPVKWTKQEPRVVMPNAVMGMKFAGVANRLQREVGRASNLERSISAAKGRYRAAVANYGSAYGRAADRSRFRPERKQARIEYKQFRKEVKREHRIIKKLTKERVKLEPGLNRMSRNLAKMNRKLDAVRAAQREAVGRP